MLPAAFSSGVSEPSDGSIGETWVLAEGDAVVVIGVLLFSSSPIAPLLADSMLMRESAHHNQTKVSRL